MTPYYLVAPLVSGKYRLTALFGDRRIPVILDTGATDVHVSRKFAAELGLTQVGTSRRFGLFDAVISHVPIYTGTACTLVDARGQRVKLNLAGIAAHSADHWNVMIVGLNFLRQFDFVAMPEGALLGSGFPPGEFAELVGRAQRRQPVRQAA